MPSSELPTEPQMGTKKLNHNSTKQKMYFQGVPLEAFCTVKKSLNIKKGADLKPCLWCKDSDDNPMLFRGMYDPPPFISLSQTMFD
jgi:hypothetical protein